MVFNQRRKLGQHFLNSRKLAQRIVDFAGVKDEVVLEIGAGKGMLTQFLSASARRVFAVEFDKDLAAHLKKKLEQNVLVINRNFLKLKLSRYDHPVIIGNIPYSITSAIIEKLVAEQKYIKRAVLTVQKEYARRLYVLPGDAGYCPITLLVGTSFSVKKGFVIPPRFFSPRPKVSSVVVALDKKSSIVIKDKRKFFAFLKGIFGYQRKSIKNCILNYSQRLPRDINQEFLKKRPKDLTLQEFYWLYNKLQ